MSQTNCQHLSAKKNFQERKSDFVPPFFLSATQEKLSVCNPESFRGRCLDFDFLKSNLPRKKP
jgi:hypothetical protein